MSTAYFSIDLKIWHPTDMRVHLVCHHLLYFFVFLAELAQKNPWRFTVVNSTLWYMMFCASFCTANLAQEEVYLKFHFRWPEVHQHQSLCQVLLEILPEQQLNKLLPATREIWDFLPVLWFHKGVTQARSKMSRHSPHQSMKWVPYSPRILIT